MDSAELLSSIQALNSGITLREKADRAAVTVPVQNWPEIAKTLKADSKFGFDMLSTHTAIDWLATGKIELVYQLYSTSQKHSLFVGVLLDRQSPVSFSVSSVWPIAEWHEREIYDLFGVKFAGHPDLRRLLLEDDWKGHPLLKDYKDDFMLERPW